MSKQIQHKRLLIDNGYDWFFSDDSRFHFPEGDVEFAIKRMYEIGVETKAATKLKLDITFSDESYKTKTIASFNPNIK